MTTFSLRYGRRFRTGQYETACLEIEEDFDDDKCTVIEAHDVMRNIVDAIVDSDKEDYAREAAEKPQRRR